MRKEKDVNLKTLIFVSIASCLIAAVAIPLLEISADVVPQPGLVITSPASNEVQITITNGVTWANYELYRQAILSDAASPWVLHMVGTLGQTNFSTNMGVATIGFFRAAVGLDWDGDGIPNSHDPQPSNGSISNMVITIDSPAANANVP